MWLGSGDGRRIACVVLVRGGLLDTRKLLPRAERIPQRLSMRDSHASLGVCIESDSKMKDLVEGAKIRMGEKSNLRVFAVPLPQLPALCSDQQVMVLYFNRE